MIVVCVSIVIVGSVVLDNIVVIVAVADIVEIVVRVVCALIALRGCVLFVL